MSLDPEHERVVYEPDSAFVESTNIYEFMQTYGIDDYEALIERTTGEPGPESGVEWFWDELVEYLGIEFYEPYDAVRDDSDGPQFSRWYPGGELNIAHNTLDRHAEDRADDTAILWESEPGDVRQVSYGELHRLSNQVANDLRARDVEVGDTVALYMPMVPEVAAILYGCLKAGAIAVPIFSGFGVDATATRLEDAEATVVYTGDGFYRRGSEITLKETLDSAIEAADTEVTDVVVYERLGADVPWQEGRDVTFAAGVESRPESFETVSLPSDAAAMLLYSSGTTGQPKGIVQTHAGAQMQIAKELYFGFDVRPEDRFFWVSDIGWMMGPWSLIGTHTFGGTVFVYEGAPDHPTPNRFWELIEDHGLTQFGISPTAIRALREHAAVAPEEYDLSSLRLLGSTGEPWDPESWLWFFENVGGGDTPIINISGGTEICGCFLMPMPIQPLKPCTLGGPGLGMDIDIVDETGTSIKDSGQRGYLVARDSCPSMTKSLWSGDERYLSEYWSRFSDPPMWDHGDWAQVDEDGFWYLHGRADDVLNVAGRKVGPAEVEGAVVENEAVAAAAAIGVPDDTTGTAVVVYAVLEADREPSDELREELRSQVGETLGKPFRPREVRFTDALPMTQSGKIVRRAVQAVHTGGDIGDTSSIENPEAFESLRDAV
ncbi:MAG: AMP-binding protein [Natronomonas sp.]